MTFMVSILPMQNWWATNMDNTNRAHARRFWIQWCQIIRVTAQTFLLSTSGVLWWTMIVAHFGPDGSGRLSLAWPRAELPNYWHPTWQSGMIHYSSILGPNPIFNTFISAIYNERGSKRRFYFPFREAESRSVGERLGFIKWRTWVQQSD